MSITQVRERNHRNASAVGATLGRILEERVERVLQQLLEEREIFSYEYHMPNSLEDRAGRDFTVWAMRGNTRVILPVGVTISLERFAWCRRRHPNISLFWFPPGTRDKEIARCVLEALKRA